MLGDERVAFLESGCALILGATTPDGSPVAMRGWGLRVLTNDDDSCLRARLVVDAVDVAEGHLRDGGAIAVTGADVRTLTSIQLKGHVHAIEPTTDADLETVETFLDEFLEAIEETDGMPRTLTERMRPAGFAAAVLDVTDFYDQTPGPTAGTELDDEAGS